MGEVVKYLASVVVTVGSMLAGASVVHSILRPNLDLTEAIAKEEEKRRRERQEEEIKEEA